MKITKISVSRVGLKTEPIPKNNQTIAVAIPKGENIDYWKGCFIEQLRNQNIELKHQKDIVYKRPFWKFWSFKDCTIAVYNIENP